jgi:hypothetical protein
MNAKETTMILTTILTTIRTTITKTLAIAAVTALGLCIAPIAKAESKGCSNATLKGAYAHRASGFETAPPAIAGPLVGVGTDTFDGNGGVTTTATLSVNGNIVSLTATGTYNVNPDCTGTYTIQGGGGTTRLVFVIVDSGSEIQAICIDPGVVLTHIFRRQFPAGDPKD